MRRADTEKWLPGQRRIQMVRRVVCAGTPETCGEAHTSKTSVRDREQGGDGGGAMR